MKGTTNIKTQVRTGTRENVNVSDEVSKAGVYTYRCGICGDRDLGPGMFRRRIGRQRWPACIRRQLVSRRFRNVVETYRELV